MRQTHPAGKRMFVDYAGQTVEVIDGATDEIGRAQVFVAVLGASNFTYAEARWTQSLPDSIGYHVGAVTSFGGAPRQIVCNNLKAGVTATSRYEPGSAAPVRTWPHITARRSCRRGCGGRATRPKSRPPSRSCNVGSWPGCVTCHVRNPRQHRHTTIAEHMPSSHRRHAEWTPTRLLREAEAIGPSTIADAVLDRLVHGAHHLELKGESMRKLRAAKAKLDETTG